MKKLASLVAAGAALLGLALSQPLEAHTSSRSANAALAQQASEALGLSRSLVADVQALPVSSDRILAGIGLPGAPVVLDLQVHSVRAEGFEVRAQLDDGSWVLMPDEPVRTYRGTVFGEPDSRVAASMLGDGLHARVQLADGQEYWIEPLAARLATAAPSQHAVYRTEDVRDHGGNCDADLLASGLVPETHSSKLDGPSGGVALMGGVTAEIGCDADFEYYSRHGAGTQARIESVINTLNLQYSGQVQITHQITTLLIRTSSNDPYTKRPADQLLVEFRSEWNTNQTGVQRDVAHLFTGRDLAGNTIGIAYLNAVCNLGLAYGLVQSDFASNFACVTDLSAHELGHNWGAGHCSCSGFTMNASITCANVFSGTSINAITAYRNSQSCFGAPPATGSVAGTVTSSDGGLPIAGATVQVDTGQADTTDANGVYTIAGVPTGTRSVTASAPGFDAASQNVNVTENATATADFSLNPAPAGSQAVVECITYRSTGGQNGDRNLFIDILIQDDAGNPVAGASVSVSVDLDGSLFGTATGTTDSAGAVTFQAKNSPNGCFVTDVTGVSAAGLSFDGTEPTPNGFDKGTDPGPDADCRSSSDGC